MEKIEAINIIESISSFTTKIDEILKKHEYIRRGSKQNFNFFEAIANERTHLEKYYSNFLYYLLNPKSSHDSGTFFLKEFLEILPVSEEQKWINSIPESELKNATVNVERLIPANDRRIDITIEYQKEWIIFIENKINSGEGFEQLNDYYNFSKEFRKQLPIFLTKTGYKPLSVEKNSENEILSISYKVHIINWIKKCTNELIRYPNITAVLLQFIDTIKLILNVMEDIEMQEIVNYFEGNRQKVSNILKHKAQFDKALQEFIQKEREIFIEEYRKQFVSRIKTDLNEVSIVKEFEGSSLKLKYNQIDFQIEIGGWDTGNDGGIGSWWGIYDTNKNGISCGLEEGNYESIFINNIRDFVDDIKGAAEIIAINNCDLNPNPIIEKSINIIIEKIKTNGLKALKQNFYDNNPKRRNEFFRLIRTTLPN